MDLEITIRLDEGAEIPLAITSQTGPPPIADRMEVSWNAVLPNEARAEFFNGDDLVLGAQIDIGQALGTVFSPIVQIVGPQRIIGQMMSSDGELWTDRITRRPGHTEARCLSCGDKIFGHVATRGACLACFPMVDMDLVLDAGCPTCDAGPEDECTMDCPSRGLDL